jgi:Flp pilus assembly protein TadG
VTARHDTMQRSPARRVGRVRHGAAGLLFFALIGVPCLFFAATLAVDFTLQVMAANQATSVAEATASAGSFQQRESSNRLDASASRHAMEATFNRAVTERVATLATDLSLDEARPTATQVHVTVSYAVPLRAYSSWFRPGADMRNERRTITRSAQVCTPGQTAPTGGHCAAPRPN